MPNKEKLSSTNQNILRILDTLGLKYEVEHHQPVYTMQQAEEVSRHAPEEGVKTLLLKSKTGKHYLVVWRGDRRVDYKQIQTKLNEKVSMASPEDVLSVLGVEVGAVTPFGYDTRIPVVFDRTILEVQYSYINPGVNDATIKLHSHDLLQAIMEWTGPQLTQL